MGLNLIQPQKLVMKWGLPLIYITYTISLVNMESPTIRILTSPQGNTILYAISNWLIKVKHTKRINCASLCIAEKTICQISANSLTQVSSCLSFQTNSTENPILPKTWWMQKQKLEYCNWLVIRDIFSPRREYSIIAKTMNPNIH